jgi:hypothetical protein
MMTMGGQDDAVARSGRLVTLGESRPPQLPDGRSQTGRGGNQIAALAQSREGGGSSGDGRLPVELCRDVFSDRCAKATHEAAMIKEGNERAFGRSIAT